MNSKNRLATIGLGVTLALGFSSCDKNSNVDAVLADNEFVNKTEIVHVSQQVENSDEKLSTKAKSIVDRFGVHNISEHEALVFLVRAGDNADQILSRIANDSGLSLKTYFGNPISIKRFESEAGIRQYLGEILGVSADEQQKLLHSIKNKNGIQTFESVELKMNSLLAPYFKINGKSCRLNQKFQNLLRSKYLAHSAIDTEHKNTITAIEDQLK